MTLKRKFRKVKSPKPQVRVSRPSKQRLIKQNVAEGLTTNEDSAQVTGGTSYRKAEQQDQYDILNSPNSYETVPSGVDAESSMEDGGEAPFERNHSAADTIENGAGEVDPGSQFNNSDSIMTPVEDEFDGQDVPNIEQKTFAEEDAIADPIMAEEDAIREQRYIYFTEEGDDEGDYTGGPPRMIMANDGLKDCVALLMTLPLSIKIQRAIRSQQDLENMKRKALRERGVYTRFGRDLQNEINSHKIRLSGNEDMDEAHKSHLEEEVSNLELMLETNKAELVRIQSQVDYQADVFREQQKEVNADLEEALIRAQLLVPGAEGDEERPEDLDLQQEYQKFVRGMDRSEAGTPVTVTFLDTNRDYQVPEQDSLPPEQQREADLKDTVWQAFWRHHYALEAFERRDTDRHAEYLANTQAAEQGEVPTDESPEAFDLRWVQKIQELTRELIEAESGLSAAKAVAAEEGLDIAFEDRASGFADDVADGYRISMEQAMIGSVPSPKIKDWMSGIPEVASPSFNEPADDVDEWEAGEVEMSDSVSMVAQNAGERKRIDKWRRVCGLE